MTPASFFPCNGREKIRNPKVEIGRRRPKPEGRPKSEGRDPKAEIRRGCQKSKVHATNLPWVSVTFRKVTGLPPGARRKARVKRGSQSDRVSLEDLQLATESLSAPAIHLGWRRRSSSFSTRRS
jgi:hypothetical protein